MDSLSDILATFRLNVEIIHSAQYCGDWAIDTSGAGHVCFHLVTHGRCIAKSDCMAQPEELLPGDLIIFPHDSAHSLESESNCKVTLNAATSRAYDEGLQNDGVGLLCGYFQFSNRAHNPLLTALPNVMIKKQDAANKKDAVQVLMTLVKNESLQQRPGNQAAINRLTESLFILLVREFLDDESAKSGIAAALANPGIAKALDALHANAAHDWSVEELASMAAMSRSAFAEQFKALMNETPIAYATRWRMQNAWQWLQEDNATVYDVAVRCGYETEASFSKAFKRAMGETPGKVRKKN